MRGKVYLVGAGPGDPGLITQRGLEVLSGAEVLIYDNLIDERILEWAAPAAERIFAGKSGAAHFKEQAEINRLLVEKARENKIVVRLKGGDPFVLGRGGEEAETLAAHGVPFEVVPGISSAIAVPAYAGIPVTQRGLASSFAVVTGHEEPNKSDSAINWPKLATAVDTLVFLMGMQNLAKISAALIENGRSPATPVAVIKEGTRPEQKVVSGTLADIVEKVKKARLGPPAVIVVGEVTRLREKLAWFDKRPLFGKRVLVTRSRQQASSLSHLLAARGARPVEQPVIDIQYPAANPPLEAAIENLAQFQWIIFTSVNGVAPFFDILKQKGLDSRALARQKIGVIGPATAEALAARGLKADFCPPVFTSAGILAGLRETGLAGQSVLLPRAELADKELAEGLAGLGARVTDIPTYQTSAVAQAREKIPALFAAGDIDVVTFTSSSTVTNLLAAFGDRPVSLQGAKVACIGPKTAQTATRGGLPVDILAREQTIPGLVEAIESYFEKERR